MLIKKNFTDTILFYVLFLVAIIIAIVSLLTKNNYIDINLFFNKSVLKEVLEKLEVVNKLLKEKKYQEFQSDLLSVLFLYVSKKFSIKKGNLSIEHIKNALAQGGVDNDIILAYLDLIEYLERCKYSPHQGDKINKDLYSRAVELINKIDSNR